MGTGNSVRFPEPASQAGLSSALSALLYFYPAPETAYPVICTLHEGEDTNVSLALAGGSGHGARDTNMEVGCSVTGQRGPCGGRREPLVTVGLWKRDGRMERGRYTRQNHVQPHMRLLTSVRQARSYLESRSCWRNKRQTKKSALARD